jgi:hypothetical protein
MLLEIVGSYPNCEQVNNFQYCQVINKLESILQTDKVSTIIALAKVFQDAKGSTLRPTSMYFDWGSSTSMPFHRDLPVLEVVHQDRDECRADTILNKGFYPQPGALPGEGIVPVNQISYYCKRLSSGIVV